VLDKIKELPTPVLLSFTFLAFLWIVMMLLNPWGTIAFSIFVLAIASGVCIYNFLKTIK